MTEAGPGASGVSLNDPHEMVLIEKNSPDKQVPHASARSRRQCCAGNPLDTKNTSRSGDYSIALSGVRNDSEHSSYTLWSHVLVVPATDLELDRIRSSNGVRFDQGLGSEHLKSAFCAKIEVTSVLWHGKARTKQNRIRGNPRDAIPPLAGRGMLPLIGSLRITISCWKNLKLAWHSPARR